MIEAQKQEKYPLVKLYQLVNSLKNQELGIKEIPPINPIIIEI